MSSPFGAEDGPPSGAGGFNLDGLLSQALDMQHQMAQAQEELAETEVVGEAAGGKVRVTVTGQFEVRRVDLDPSVVDPHEADLLADLVTAALRSALDGVLQLQSDRMNTGLPDVGQLLGGLGDLGGLIGFGDPHDPADEIADLDPNDRALPPGDDA